MVDDFLMYIEAYTADQLLIDSLDDKTYVRMQVTTDAQMDSIEPSNIKKMVNQGNQMFTKPMAPASQDKFLAILRDIIDDKFKN